MHYGLDSNPLDLLKHKIDDTPEQDLIVGVLKDFLDQLQELKKRRSQIQSIDSQELVMEEIQDVIEDEDGGLNHGPIFSG